MGHPVAKYDARSVSATDAKIMQYAQMMFAERGVQIVTKGREVAWNWH